MNTRAWQLLLTTATMGALIILNGSIARAEVQPTPSFSFGAAGDFDFGKAFKATAAAVTTQNPDFLLALGDLGYDTKEKEWCNYWKNTAKYNNVLLIAGKP